MRRASSRAGRDELNLENLMTDICISTALIIAAFAWYLIARRFPIVPQGPKYLRGSVGVGLVMYAAYATVVYANQYTPDSWSTALSELPLCFCMSYWQWLSPFCFGRSQTSGPSPFRLGFLLRGSSKIERPSDFHCQLSFFTGLVSNTEITEALQKYPLTRR